ncbi:MAG: hypothetical protein LQ342_007340 [Letrouitia transgressa]|nr:MAG: hypothetical protein LQ342_007340 [Letrouitia transgressa]
MTTALPIASRIRGSLYGVAVCDALGGPVEFCRRGSFPLVTSYRHNDNFDLPPGSWTDDTSMTLCLAQSLVDCKGKFVLEDQIKKYVAWFENGYMSSNGECFDIGNNTRIALSTWKLYLKKYPSDEVIGQGQADIDRALKKKVQSGNGSLMRVASIGLVYHDDLRLALQNASLSAQVTHPYPTNSEACKLYTKLIVAALQDASKSDLASAVGQWAFEDPDLRARFAKYSDLSSFANTPEEDISSSGYVVHSLEASLWAFFTTDSFSSGALKVVNLGHDADTVGAIYGGVAGAYYGIEAIPAEWLTELEAKEVIDAVVEGVVALVTVKLG